MNLKIGKTANGLTERVDSRGIVITAMELSLHQQGINVSLSRRDLNASLDKISPVKMYGAVLFSDMIYVIDIWGVKENRSKKRYIARSYALKSLADLTLQLSLKRPVLLGLFVYEDWFDPKVNETGVINYIKPKGKILGGTLGVIIGWNESDQLIKLMTDLQNFGMDGIIYINKEALEKSIDRDEMRAIEVAKMPVPFSPVKMPYDVHKKRKKLSRHHHERRKQGKEK